MARGSYRRCIVGGIKVKIEILDKYIELSNLLNKAVTQEGLKFFKMALK